MDVGMIPLDPPEGISDGGIEDMNTSAVGAWGDVVAGFRKNHLVPVDQLRLGTLEQAIGVDAAEEFFNEPDPVDDARRSAAARLGS